MDDLSTYKAKCKRCKSDAYYTPVLLLLETRTFSEPAVNKASSPKIVDIECTGEDTGTRHTCTYVFPSDFTKL